MNAINRVGQKVCCIADRFYWRTICPSLTAPKENETYTVAGFADLVGHPGVHLVEIEGFNCTCAKLAGAPWPLAAFRPVDERKTDIGELTKLLQPTKHKVDA